MRAVLGATSVFFIDEMSMMTSDMLMNVLQRLIQMHQCSYIEQLMEKVLIVLVGDHGQVSTSI